MTYVTPARKYRWQVRLMAALFSLFTALLFCEIAARIVTANSFQIELALKAHNVLPVSLQPYQIKDPARPGNYLLNPSTDWTLGKLIEVKSKSGAVKAVAHFQEIAGKFNLSMNDVMFHINKHGYKGPEIDDPAKRFRILLLGDSCTFGSFYDAYSYPGAMRAAFGKMGVDAEIINAGVEAYTPEHILLRIEEFKRLKPDIVLIYAGWNGIFRDNPYYENGPTLHLIRYIHIALDRLNHLSETQERRALRLYEKKKRPDKNDEFLTRLNDYRPATIDAVERIASHMRASGSEVALVTLPGLYLMDEEPAAGALEKGHLPAYTDNPYMLAKVTERYNHAVSEHARAKGYLLIDLDKWSRSALKPREEYFMDSVHLTLDGQKMLGEEIAGRLAPITLAMEKANGVGR